MNIEHLKALREQRKEVVALIEQQKSILQQIDDRITDVLSDNAFKIMEAAGKNSGDVTMTLADGTKYKASVSKTVKWDSDALKEGAKDFTWDEVRSMFKIDFSVPEANYQALQKLKPELAEKVAAARTVKYGDIKIIPIE